MVKIIARLFTLLLLGFTLTSYAQTGRVTGTVTDGTTGETLPGASVLVQGTTTGTVTNMDGRFELNVPSGQITLVASFLGYNPTTRQINVPAGGSQVVNFVLGADVTMLQEFIVIGYGVQRREDATGSIAVVGEADFNRGNITTPSELLMGKMAGVQITSGGGAPGAGETIRIRGGSSLTALNDPLYVIDGVPVDSRGISGMRSPLSTINPNDIATFTVLKDASATAIYGSRASNGVIIITTKKGKAGQGLRLAYNGTYSLSTNAKRIEVLTAGEFRDAVNENFGHRPGVVALLGDANTNWQDAIYQDAFGHDHNVSATGAMGNMPYRASLGFSSHDGVLRTDNMTRTTLSIGLDPTFLNDDLKLTINARGVNARNRFANNGAIGAAAQYDPTQPIYSGTDDFGGYSAWYSWYKLNNTDSLRVPVPVATSNPVAMIELRDDKSTVNRIITNAQIDYRMPFLPQLRANLNLGYDYSKSEGNVNVPDYATFAFGDGGQQRYYSQERKNELLEFYMNYVTDLPSLQSRIDVMGGYSWQNFFVVDSVYDSNIPNSIGYQVGRVPQNHRVDANRWPTENRIISFYGRLQYNLMERYLLTATLRQDGSSRTGINNKWGLFPSAALAWRIDQEEFMQNVDVLSELKLRAGYGVTGQQSLTGGDYPALSRYSRNIQRAYYFFGDEMVSTLRPEGYDENLKWEETSTYNMGLDYSFANDRFTGSLDFYFRETRDLLNFISIPAGTNLTNMIVTNIGSMENKGVEFSINTRPVVTNDMVWRLGLNATYSETVITKLTLFDEPGNLGVRTGGISGGVGSTIQMHSTGHAPYSFFVYQQVYDENGKPIEGLYVDRNGDGQIDDYDRYHHKKPTADVFLGVNSALEYGNFIFSFAGRASLGNYMYNNVSSMNGELSRLYRAEGNYLSNITHDAFDVNFGNAQYLSDYYIQNASFFKMDNISLAYNLGNLVPAVNNLTLSFTVQNAFVISKYKGIDPEIAFGIDNNFYPRPRNFVLGLNAQF
jgi:TonB-dependent starch-binding outer membrane protein SusC